MLSNCLALFKNSGYETIYNIIQYLSKETQICLFSATMPKSIADLASSFLHNAVKVDVSPEEITVDRIAQKIMFVRKADKRRLIVKIIKQERVSKGIVFTRTKHGANRLVKQLAQSGINAAAIHGNKSQGARTKALAGFKDGRIPILVATDIASRGIDVDGITHVFNYDLPNEPVPPVMNIVLLSMLFFFVILTIYIYYFALQFQPHA